MLQVNEVLHLSLFKEFNLIAGTEGLSNEMRNIVILEYESINNLYNVFSEGDFILTSLFFAKDNPELITIAFKELIKRKISAFAVKTIFYSSLPEEVILLANQHNIPIFLFESAYMEDLILSANELLKTKLQYLVLEEKITNLLHREPSPYEIKETLKEINPEFHDTIITAYITSKTAFGKTTIQSYFHRLIYKKYKHSTKYCCSYIKYQNGILLISTFPSNEKISQDSYPSIIYEQLKYIDITPEHFNIGISDSPMLHKEFITSLTQAIRANGIAQLEDEDYILYSQLGIYQFFFPMLHDHNIKTFFSNAIEALQAYDQKYTSNILDTMTVYIRFNGDIAKTAKEMFQHPNTIRYRIKKAYSILGLNSQSNKGDSYEQLYIIIKLHELSQINDFSHKQY